MKWVLLESWGKKRGSGTILRSEGGFQGNPEGIRSFLMESWGAVGGFWGNPEGRRGFLVESWGHKGVWGDPEGRKGFLVESWGQNVVPRGTLWEEEVSGRILRIVGGSGVESWGKMWFLGEFWGQKWGFRGNPEGGRGFPGESWGQKGVSRGILRAEEDFLWNPEGRRGFWGNPEGRRGFLGES